MNNFPPKDHFVWGYDKGYDFEIKGHCNTLEEAAKQAQRLNSRSPHVARAALNPEYVSWINAMIRSTDEMMMAFGDSNMWMTSPALREIRELYLTAFQKLLAEVQQISPSGTLVTTHRKSDQSNRRGERPDDDTL